MVLCLYDFEKETRYELHWMDSGETTTLSGSELIEKGVEIRINENPGSQLLTYKKI
jgi:hypothetical protein